MGILATPANTTGQYSLAISIGLESFVADLATIGKYLTVLFLQPQAHFTLFQKWLLLILLGCALGVYAFNRHGMKTVLIIAVLLAMLGAIFSIGFVSDSNVYRYNGVSSLSIFHASFFIFAWIAAKKIRPAIATIGIVLCVANVAQMYEAGAVARATFTRDISLANNLFQSADILNHPERKIAIYGRCDVFLYTVKKKKAIGWNWIVTTPGNWQRTIIETGSAACQKHRLNAALHASNHFYSNMSTLAFTGPFIRLNSLDPATNRKIANHNTSLKRKSGYQIIDDNLYVYHLGYP